MNITTITLQQFEELDGARAPLLRQDWRTAHKGFAPCRRTEARMESRLYDAIIDILGYEDASNVADLGHYADELITDCLIGKVEVLDAEVAA